MAATHAALTEIERTIQTATAKHNAFLNELGLPLLPMKRTIEDMLDALPAVRATALAVRTRRRLVCLVVTASAKSSTSAAGSAATTSSGPGLRACGGLGGLKAPLRQLATPRFSSPPVTHVVRVQTART